MKKKWLLIGTFFCFSTMNLQLSTAYEEQVNTIPQESEYPSLDPIFKDDRKINFQFNKFDVVNNKLQTLDMTVEVEDPTQYLDLGLKFENSQNQNQNQEINEFKNFPLLINVAQTARGDELPFPGSIIIENPPTQEEVKELFGISNDSREAPPKNVQLDFKEWVVGQDGKLEKGVFIYEEEPQDFPNVSKAKLIITINKKKVAIQAGIMGNDLVGMLGEGESLLIWVLQKLKFLNPKTVGKAAFVINQAIEEFSRSLKPDLNQLNKIIKDQDENFIENERLPQNNSFYNP